jgi:uncharacterized protein YceH (UPF0502 family)
MQLTAVEVRILGALIEKESTTPDTYPLSLNALTTACNQTSNRDPVMELADDAVRWAVNNLRQQSLVRAIQPSDSRVMKFQHLVREKLAVEDDALAVLCVLMLRGPQTTGEIRTRTGRLAEFSTLADVEATLAALVARELVAELPRRPGQKEARFTHLLSGPVEGASEGELSVLPAPTAATIASTPAVDPRITALEATVDDLRRELEELRAQFDAFKREFA